MKSSNKISEEKINTFIERINRLSDEQFEKYINLLYQSNLILEDSGQEFLHQD